MDPTSDGARLKNLVEKAKDILIVTHGSPTYDSLGSAFSLYLGLRSIGKRVVIGCPTAMTVEFSSFVGADKLQQAFVKKNFVISLDYEDGSIDKVTYNIDGNKFNLIIEPRVGFPGFSQDHVSYSHQGTPVDLIMTVDTIHLGGLGDLYEKEKELYATHPIINIDSHEKNTRYGAVNIISSAGTTAEAVAAVLSELGVTLTEDIATNILHAIYKTTNSFQTQVTARTFEVAAQCVKAGGKQIIPQQHQPEEVVAPPKTQSPPEDWLKPKIYKSSSLL